MDVGKLSFVRATLYREACFLFSLSQCLFRASNSGKGSCNSGGQDTCRENGFAGEGMISDDSCNRGSDGPALAGGSCRNNGSSSDGVNSGRGFIGSRSCNDGNKLSEYYII